MGNIMWSFVVESTLRILLEKNNLSFLLCASDWLFLLFNGFQRMECWVLCSGFACMRHTSILSSPPLLVYGLPGYVSAAQTKMPRAHISWCENQFPLLWPSMCPLAAISEHITPPLPCLRKQSYLFDNNETHILKACFPDWHYWEVQKHERRFMRGFGSLGQGVSWRALLETSPIIFGFCSSEENGFPMSYVSIVMCGFTIVPKTIRSTAHGWKYLKI